MRTQIKRVVTLVMVLLLVLVSACISTAERATPPPASGPIPAPIPEPVPAAKWGIIEIRVTDPPPADVISANVTLDNIEVHREGGGWETIDIGENVTFDLMDVIGVTEVLGSANVTAGSFTQIRMNVAKVDVVFSTDSGTDNVTARVPSEKLKIVKAFEVIGGTKTALTLDFDGKRSLVLPGKDIATGKQKAIFKPVVHLLVEHPAEQPTVTYQPDNWVRNQGGSWVGNDVYDLTGNSQAVSQSVANNVTANYEIRIQNDGNSSDSFIVTGNATSGNWTVEYYDSLSVNITANVTGSGWSTGTLTSGNDTWISANVTPSGLPDGSSFDVLVTSQSVGDSDQKDTVKISTSTSVTVTYQPDNWVRNQGGSWVGNDVYDLTGNSQAVSQSVANNVTANYEIRIQNDGNSSDSFIVTGNATSGNWTVEYYDSLSVNITANVTGSGWSTGALTSGNYTWISANVTPSGLPGGSFFDVLVTSQSVGDSNQKDTVMASSNVTAG